MERRKFLQSVALTGMAATALSSCAGTVTSTDETPKEEMNQTGGIGSIMHVVYFWLKEGITEAEENDFLKFFQILKSVPGVHSLHVSKPAATNPRDVVDNSFSYCIFVGFANLADINTYETHPTHTDASEKYKKYWTKVMVHDSTITDRLV